MTYTHAISLINSTLSRDASGLPCSQARYLLVNDSRVSRLDNSTRYPYYFYNDDLVVVLNSNVEIEVTEWKKYLSIVEIFSVNKGKIDIRLQMEKVEKIFLETMKILARRAQRAIDDPRSIDDTQ